MSVKMINGGVTLTVEESDVQRLKQAGYKRLDEQASAPAEEQTPVSDVSIADIYIMCEKAGVSPDELELGPHPLRTDVQSAIQAALNRKAMDAVNNPPEVTNG